MLINLLPDFLAAVSSSDPVAGYIQYFTSHQELLRSYWHNYVLDPEGPHFLEVVRSTALADRTDLRAMLDRTDVLALAAETQRQCEVLLQADVETDIVLMVGVGAANAGELVVGGRGVAFVCLEHFTGVANPETQGLGLDAALLPLWLAHEIAHAVRYTSPGSRSEMRQLTQEAGGEYSYWDTGRRATLRELLVNEGLAVTVARAAATNRDEWEYFGYSRRQYARVRELESLLSRLISPDLDATGLGLRLRYLSGGLSDQSRTIDGLLLPERAGYYVGARMVERAVAERGLPWSVRASAAEITAVASASAA